jgi:ATP-dependent helicase/nuclease subunit B
MAEGDNRTSPQVFTIPAHVPFAEAVAANLLGQATADPLALAKTRIFVPNRRAARALADAFLRQSDGGLLLPRLQPLGDLDALDDVSVLSADVEAELPAAMGNFERLLALAPLIKKWGSLTRARAFNDAEVLKYARELARQVDQFDYAGVTFTALKKLAQENYADHWKQILAFLNIIFVEAPHAWSADGKIGAAARRIKSIDALALAWAAKPPVGKIIVAGSTGSIPAVAGLMKVIARLPQGAVVLPSLDLALDHDSWQDLRPSHAQYALKQVLEQMDVNRAEVQAWPSAITSAPQARTDFVNAALWPAARTSQWRSVKLDAAAFADVQVLEAATDGEEARAIALHVRDQLQKQGRTIAIVTANRPLARRIASALQRFGITVDDSAGLPLTQTLPAIFLRQLARMANGGVLPVDLLALVKHPFSGGGMVRTDWLERVRVLDKQVLRGSRPAPGLAGMASAIAVALPRPDQQPLRELAGDVIGRLTQSADAFCQLCAKGPQPAISLLHAHIDAAQALAATELETGEKRLWRGEAGQLLAQTLGDIAAALPADFAIAGEDYGLWFEELLAGQVVRPRFGKHPRVSLLSPIEARLQRADVMILAGLNEGSWPPAPQVDPFLADHMRDRLGLPTSEFRLGQSAHDFVQSMGAAAVLLTRSQKSGGAPAIPSRFWLRLRALGGAKLTHADDLLAWTRALDQGPVLPVSQPLPVPPRSARPAELYVSDMTLWRQNPYAFYARKILGLRPLDAIDAEPGPLDRGISLHKALELFFRRPHGERFLENLLADGRTAFADILDRPQVRAFWWPRFEALAHAVCEDAYLMVGTATRSLTEVTGGWTMPVTPLLKILGRADRIDVTDGHAVIYDYKSGAAPSADQIWFARHPQMALLALMAQVGGFDGAGPLTPAALKYVKISGRLPDPMTIEDIKKKDWQEIPELLAKTAALLTDWVAIFDAPGQAYKFLQVPDESYGHDYDVLARLDEWRSNA